MLNRNLGALAIAFALMLNGCVRGTMDKLKMREEYMACSSSPTSAGEFRDYILSFARQEKMRILDRGEEAEMELRDLDQGRVVLVDRT